MKTEYAWGLGLFLAIVVTAALVNRLAPSHRPRVRRIAILFIVYAVVMAVALILPFLGVTEWAGRFRFAADLLGALTVVNVVGTVGFSVLLPRAGVVVPMIASDLVIGVGYILATLGVLSNRGLNPTGVLATSAVVSAVLAISLQSTLGNILGGVALQLDGSIREGDWIQLENGKQGRVRSVRWRHTVVETRDWSTIIVPNAQLLGNNITILGKRDGRSVPQRMWVWFNVDYRFPPTQVIAVVSEALVGSPIQGVSAEPPPNVVCMDFTKDNRESVATYAVRYWLTDLAADDPTNSRVRARIYAALRRAGIPLAVPAATAFVEMKDELREQKRQKRHFAARLAALRTVHLFRALTEEELGTLARGMSHVIYTDGETITRQGAIAHFLYVLTSGSAEIRTRVEATGESKVVATLRGPDFFGEMGLMTGEPRLADVVATTDVECFKLGKETFEQVLLGRPEIATELSEKLAARRIELIAFRENLDATAKQAREASERERILGAITSFFGL